MLGSLDEPQPRKAVLYIQMQLCELTMRQWLQTRNRESSLEANRPYLVQAMPPPGAAPLGLFTTMCPAQTFPVALFTP